MTRLAILATSVVAATHVLVSAQGGALSKNAEKLQSEVFITVVAEPELAKQLASHAMFEHTSEITRGGPVAAVVRVPGCEKDANGVCRLNVDLVVYAPDGKVYYEKKSLQLPTGRVTVPLTFDAKAAHGVYRVVATIRDLTAKRFATVERQFGVK